MKNYIKEITAGAFLLTLFTGLAVWFIEHNPDAVIEVIYAGFAILLGMILYVANQIKKRKELKAENPSEDEFTKLASLHAGNTSFLLSLILWGFIYILRANFPVVEEIPGIEVLGATLIYSICLWHYKSTGKFNEKSN